MLDNESHSLDWQERDERIIRTANVHVCIIRHFFRFFASQEAAYRRIAKLREQGKLRQIGKLLINPNGRPQDVYCNCWRPKVDHLRHEILLTDFLLCYPDATIHRGWTVDRRIRPDAEMHLANRLIYVELDTGTESFPAVRRRQKSYDGVDDFVLYVTLDDKRLDGLVKNASSYVKKIALFTMLDLVIDDPWGDVWIDCFGNIAGL